MIAFVMNAVAQWNEDPIIRETHWFGQYEYVDIQPGFVQRKINWSDNYIESTEIWRSSTGDGQLAHQPKTSYYSWLEHELRFSVDETAAWAIRGTNNTAYNPKQFNPDNGGGQGLRNTSGSNQNFYIHNLKAGDSYDVRYYLDGGNSESHITGSATGTATVSIPANAVIRNVVITLAEYQASDFKVEEVSNVSDITSSYAGYANLQTSNFGDLGYRYSFKHAGVLEDKHGAVPYMTMSFGNDNDMTFVRKVSSESTTLVQTGTKTITHQPGQPDIKVYAKNRGQQDPTQLNQATGDVLGNYFYTVTNTSNPNNGNAWDCQFFINCPALKDLPVGAEVEIKFRCYATHSITDVAAQAHGAPGSYINTENLFLANMSQSWDEHTFTFAVTDAMVAGNFQTIAFNLNTDNQNNELQFAGIILTLPQYTEAHSEDVLAAASIINEHNELDPTKKRLQYPWTYKNNSNYQDPFSEEEIKDRFVGKEWSTFTAEEDPTHTVRPENSSQWVNDEEYVFGDKFNSIWPLCGNFFYFFPEVDGLLEVEYYCEGSNEVAAFWYKQKENGDYVDGSGQPKTQFINTNSSGDSNTNGSNNYKLRVNVEKGGIYYLCSLPTNLHQQPIIRLKSYTFVPRFRVAPLYKVVSNTEVTNGNAAIQKVAEITGGPYTNLDGTERNYGTNSYDLANNTFERNAEQEPRIKCLGNVVSAKAKIDYEGGKQYLSFYDIKFREATNAAGEAYNPGGAVVVHVNNSVGQASFVLTIAYDAADAKWNDDKTQRVAATNGGTEVKRWDFYSGLGDGSDGGWDLGKYPITKNADGEYVIPETDKTWFKDHNNTWANSGKSKLFKEVNKADGLTTDWEFDYVDVPNKKEPIFKSIYDMEADNADMIHETAGLVFFTEPNELGIWNENDASTTSYSDRFIGLMGGGKLIIPRLKANDRVVIKMGCFGNVDGIAENSDFEQKAILNITNAKDALGKAISPTANYEIGGSMPYTGETQPRGEYHFIVAEDGESDDTDFAIELKEGGLLKIYSIVIYRNAKDNNADILTENELVVDNGLRQILNTAEYTYSDKLDLHPRYRGKDEPANVTPTVELKTGNLQSGDVKIGGDTFTTTYELNDISTPKFGVFKTRQGVQTYRQLYVTDYAYCMIPVGYRETQTYPYTWDFTDLKKYVSAGIDEDGIEKEVAEADADLRIWNNWNLRVKPEEWDGSIFVSGGQLYGGKTMFDETRGIGIVHNDKGMSMTSEVVDETDTKENGGLAFSDEYGFILPQLAPEQAIYIRAHAVNGATTGASYEMSDGTTTYKYTKNVNTGTSFSYNKKTAADGSGDVVFAMVMPSELETVNGKADVRLNFKGYEVKKIAVSDAPKTLSAKGWTSESRDYVTDPSLTAYMTGKKFRTFIVSGVNYDERVVTLTRIDNDYLMPAVETEVDEETGDKEVTGGENNACVILNGTSDSGIEGSSEGVFDSQFHLFVPDMHDYGTEQGATYSKSLWNGDSKMKAKLYAGSVNAVDGNYTNFAFTCKYYDIDPKTGIIKPGQSEKKVGPQAFYRIAGGATGTASSIGNQGYLPILTSEVGYPVEDNSGAGARFTLVIIDDNEATGIATVERIVQDGRFYNLNGQQLNGIPNRSGLYIVNGKKVYIKNK